MNHSGRSPIGFIAFVVLVDTLGIGLILPVVPRLIREMAGVGVEDAAAVGGMLMFTYAGMQFLFAPLIGGLSDRFGRRPVLLAALFLLGLDYAVMALAPTLAWLFAGRLISGIVGATWAAANSAIADSVPDADRGKAFGLLGGAGAAGFVLGPVIGGLAGEFGTRVPFIIASGLALASAAVGFLVLRESLPVTNRRRLDLSRANPLGSIWQVARSPFLLACLWANFFILLSRQAHMTIWAYWGEFRFGWTPLTSGLTISLYGILMGLIQVALTGPSISKLGAARTAVYSSALGLPSLLILAFAPSIEFVLAAIVIGSFAGLAFPALQSLMTQRVGSDAQGELQGAVASVQSLSAIIGPIMMSQIFSQFAGRSGFYFPGAPYLVSFLLLLLSIGIMVRTFRASTAAPEPH